MTKSKKKYCSCKWGKLKKFRDDHPPPCRATWRGKPDDCDKCENTGYRGPRETNNPTNTVDGRR